MYRRFVVAVAVITALAMPVSIVAGCARKVATTPPATTETSQASGDIAAAKDLLGKALGVVAQVGRAGGPTGSAAVSATVEAEAALKDAHAKLDSAKAALTATPDVAAQTHLAAVQDALSLADSALPLGRALAIEDVPAQQAVDGWNKLAQAIPLGNSDEYAKALVLSKAARSLLAQAETALAGPAKTYPGSPTIESMRSWAADARALADTEIKMHTAGKKGQTATYNKLVERFNAQKAAVNSRPDPGTAWNSLNDDWRAAYDKAQTAFSALD